jgi:peptidoglycan/xylan/chitin deacetylase (PgdA/CDA1 family)
MRRVWAALALAAACLAGLALALRAAHGASSPPQGRRWMAARRGIVYFVWTAEPVVALTFDDGPDPRTTPAVLAQLRAAHARATFFVQGSMAERWPGLVREIVRQGSEVGDHSYSHRAPDRLTPESLRRDVQRSARAIELAAGTRPRLFRFPRFRQPAWAVEELNRLGYVVVAASLDPQDWRAPPPDVLAARVVRLVRPGDIVVLHDGGYRPRTVRALGEIIRALAARGYRFATVSDLLALGRPSWAR